MSLGLKTIRAVKIMKIGIFLLWITAMLLAFGFAVKPQALDITMHNGDKILHMTVFMVLTFIPVLTFDKMRSAMLGVVFLALLGTGIEFTQHFMPSRTADIMDVASNMVGIAFGMIVGWALRGSYQSFLPRDYVELYIEAE